VGHAIALETAVVIGDYRIGTKTGVKAGIVEISLAAGPATKSSITEIRIRT